MGSCKTRENTDAYLLTGSWNLYSGIAHANWLISIASTDMQDGTQSPMMHLLSKSYTSIDKTWEISGLRQPGSYQLSSEALMIPKYLAFTYQIKQGVGPLYQIPLNLLFAGEFADVALGTSRAAIEH